jgi:hypothetical protein
MTFPPQQRLAFAAELFDRGAQKLSPQRSLQSLSGNQDDEPFDCSAPRRKDASCPEDTDLGKPLLEREKRVKVSHVCQIAQS